MTNSILPGLGLRDLAGAISTQRVKVTPTMAAKWLARNHRNRTLSSKTVDQYAQDMEAGQWTFTGQALIFDSGGHLVDGQHRLTAQIKANVTLEWLVVVGVDVETRDFIDIGRPRTVGNQLQIKGTGNTGVAAVARLDLIYAGEWNPSKPSVRAHAEAHIDSFHQGARIGHGIAQVIYGSTAAYGVAFHHLSQIDAESAQWFFGALQTGADLGATSPILVARNHIARTRASRSLSDAQRVLFINYLFRCWNLWAVGKRCKTFSAPAGTVVPVRPISRAAA